MKTRFLILIPAPAALASGAAWMPSPCHAQNAQTQSAQTSLASNHVTTVCDAVRIFPRAGFASRMTGGEIQGSNESATGGI